jgi:hypothetical protein
VRDATKVSQGPRKVELVPLDVRDEGSIRSAVRTVLERAGRIDVLPSFERQRDFNPPEQRAAQRALPACRRLAQNRQAALTRRWLWQSAP